MTDFNAERTAMVDCQVRPSDVTKFPIIEAMLTVKRELYVPSAAQSVAYVGEHIPLSANRTLLDPRTFAKMLDAVNVQPNEMVLDVACGMGYSTAVLAHLAEAVVGLEDDAVMVEAATKTLTDQDCNTAVVLHGSLGKGASKHGPYDVIIIEGGVQSIPSALTKQLRDGGRIAAIFTDGKVGQCRIGFKSGNTISWRDDFDATAPVLADFAKVADFTFA